MFNCKQPREAILVGWRLRVISSPGELVTGYTRHQEGTLVTGHIYGYSYIEVHIVSYVIFSSLYELVFGNLMYTILVTRLPGAIMSRETNQDGLPWLFTI